MFKAAAATCLSLILTTAGLAQDTDAAGPDFWAVNGLSKGASLNVRSQPTTSAAILVQISQGTILRNLGCRGDGTVRWCEVSSPDGLAIKGWVSGRYLIEAAAPTDADALVAGTPYNATGELPCVLTVSPEIAACPYGVIRASTGLASIFITLPDQGERLIEFRNGEPVAPTGMTMTSSKIDDLTTVVLDGGSETYTIADVVFAGD